MALASSLQPLWLARGRIQEGLAWFDAALADLDAQHAEVAPAVRARALADKAMLAVSVGAADSLDQARAGPGDRARGRRPGPAGAGADRLRRIAAVFNAEVARPYFAEAIGLARAVGDRWRLSQTPRLAGVSRRSSRVTRSRRARPAEEGRDLADAIGDRFGSRLCRWCLGMAQMIAGRAGRCRRTIRRAGRRGRGSSRCARGGAWPRGLGDVLAYQGDTAAARAAADAAIEAAAELGGILAGIGYAALARAALAAGDAAAATGASEGPGSG